MPYEELPNANNQSSEQLTTIEIESEQKQDEQSNAENGVLEKPVEQSESDQNSIAQDNNNQVQQNSSESNSEQVISNRNNSNEGNIGLSNMSRSNEESKRNDEISVQSRSFNLAKKPVPGRELPKTLLLFIFGIAGIIAPFGGVYIATFMGKSDVSMFNSMLVMLLSTLLIVFLLINSFVSINEKKYKRFFIGILFLLVNIISFIWNILIYVTL